MLVFYGKQQVNKYIYVIVYMLLFDDSAYLYRNGVALLPNVSAYESKDGVAFYPYLSLPIHRKKR